MRPGTLLERYFPASYELVEPGATATDWGRVADELEAIYRRLAARRHDPNGNPELRRRIAKRPLIDVDLHMHTDHSRRLRDPGRGAAADGP